MKGQRVVWKYRGRGKKELRRGEFEEKTSDRGGKMQIPLSRKVTKKKLEEGESTDEGGFCEKKRTG